MTQFTGTAGQEEHNIGENDMSNLLTNEPGLSVNETGIINENTVFDTSVQCSQIWNLMFPCFGLCANRRKNFTENLRQQNLQKFEYQPSTFTFNAKQLQQSPATLKVELQTRPLFFVNENIRFIDYYTKKEQQKILTNSLPDHFQYFIQSYTSQKPLLCLDLDETLIASQPKSTTTSNFQIQVTVANIEHTYYVTKRPYLDEFLLSVAEDFELAIFTYSIKPYADRIIKIIDPHYLIKYRFYREHCVKQKINEQQYVITKDLTRVGVCLDKILLIDNAKRAGEWQPNNFILIEDFFGDQEDDRLQVILPTIKALGNVPSIYKELERHYQE